MSGNGLDDWNRWRVGFETWRNEVDNDRRRYGEEIAILKTYSQIQRDNESARRSHTPQVIFWIISGAISAVGLLVQIWLISGKVGP